MVGDGLVATLVINPVAGGAELLRLHLVEMLALLKSQGWATQVVETSADPRSLPDLRGSGLVLACGGDGTVHAVVQQLAGTSVPLGIIPVGTANALARNLGLPLQPMEALKTLLTWLPRALPLGEATTDLGRRYFMVMAGCGPDGALVQALSAGQKSRFGRQAYYGRAAQLLLTRRWPSFQVEYRLRGSGEWSGTEAVALMCSRVQDLGGMFSGLTPGARQDHCHLHVQLLKAPAQVSLPAWFALGGLWNPWLTTVDVAELRCTPPSGERVLAQVDGELLGALPMELRLVQDAVKLLMPG